MQVGLGIALIGLLPFAIHAQNHAAGKPDSQPERKPDDSFYFSFFGGGFNATEGQDRLRQEGGAYGWGLTAGYFVKDQLSFEGEFLWFRRDYERVSDTVIPGTANNDVRVLTLGLALNAKVSHRFSRWRPFGGGGVVYYDTELLTTHQESGLFTDAGQPSSERSAGFQVFAGVSAHVRKRFYLELGWGRVFLEEDFGPYSNGNADLGGDWFFLAFRGGGR
jgi:opacity protein-like surface antigen